MSVLTGALAIVRFKGTAIGFLRSVSASENFGRADVQGLGTALTSEVPITSWRGTFNASQYEVDFSKALTPDSIRRDVQTSQEFEDQLMLDQDGVQVDIFKKVEDFVDPATNLKRPKAIPYAIIKNLFVETEGFNISEGQIAGHDFSGRYLSPMIYPK